MIKAFGKHGATPLEGEKQKPVAHYLEILLQGGKVFPSSLCRLADGLLAIVDQDEDAVLV